MSPLIKSDYLYAHSDPQGSIIALTDASRNLRGQVTYSPYGESGNIARNTSFGYTGQRFDSETGLYYYKARYYSPALGRFLSTDPIGYKDNLNLYSYTNNDPLNYTDPSGLFSTFEHLSMGYTTARNSGIGVFKSIAIAFYDAQYDFVSGSQDIEKAYTHSMSNSYQTAMQAQTAAVGYIESNIEIGSAKSIGYALHTLEDNFANGHKGYQVWDGGGFLGLPDMDHIVGDWLPSQKNVSNAISSGTNLLLTGKVDYGQATGYGNNQTTGSGH